MRKPLILILLTTALAVFGFIYLLRGCLSKYDERAAYTPVLYFENGDEKIIFSLVKYEKTQSYSRTGNMVRKSVSTYYYIQCNDAKTGKKIADKKVKHHSDIKHHPVEVIGKSSNRAWLFIGELMAFDPFTLNLVADRSLIEHNNPSLNGKLSGERRFYDFDRSTGTINLTATDGTTWAINTNTLKATSFNAETDGTFKRWSRQGPESALDEIRFLLDTLVRQKTADAVSLFSSKKISQAEYAKRIVEISKERTRLYAVRDSIRKQLLNVAQKERELDHVRRRVESLNDGNVSYSEMKMNADTIGSNWFGILSVDEFTNLASRNHFHPPHKETARRAFIMTPFSARNGEILVDRENFHSFEQTLFLDGGFLADKETGYPIRTIAGSYFILHKDIIGNEGKILVSRMNLDGKVLWTINSGLKAWHDWVLNKQTLFVLGTDNEELGGKDVNVLQIIDLATGSSVIYDYFEDTIRKEK